MFRLIAETEDGECEYSDSLCCRTAPTQINCDASRLSPPKRLAVDGGHGTHASPLNLSWIGDSMSDSFELEMRVLDETADSWTRISVVTQPSYTLSNLRPGRSYAFRIAAINSRTRASVFSEIFVKS
jgi:hypothetical protein